MQVLRQPRQPRRPRLVTGPPKKSLPGRLTNEVQMRSSRGTAGVLRASLQRARSQHAVARPTEIHCDGWQGGRAADTLAGMNWSWLCPANVMSSAKPPSGATERERA